MIVGKHNSSYKVSVNYYDLLKIIAVITMIIDHIGVYYYPDTLWLRAIGRMAFPLFLFLVGYSHQYSFRFSIVIGCIFLIAVDAWTFYPIFPINILATIIVVRLLMDVAIRKNWHMIPTWQIILVLIMWYPISIFLIEYGSIAAMYALVGFYARTLNTPRRTLYPLIILVTILHAILQISSFEFKTTDAVLMVAMLTLAAVLMMQVSVNPLPVKSANLRKAIKLLSRNALLIYVVHISLFQITETVMHPGPSNGNAWVEITKQ